MPKREKCASNFFHGIWREGSASEIIRMSFSRMFGKMFFVALFLSNIAKKGLFAYLLFHKPIDCVELVLAIQCGVWICRRSKLFADDVFQFLLTSPPHRKSPICHFRSQFSTFSNSIRGHFLFEGVF